MSNEDSWKDLGKGIGKIYSSIEKKYSNPSPKIVRDHIETLLKKRTAELEGSMMGTNSCEKALFCYVTRNDGFIASKRTYLRGKASIRSLTLMSVNGNEKQEKGATFKKYYLIGVDTVTKKIPKLPLVWYEIWYASKNPQLFMNILFPDLENLKDCFSRVANLKSDDEKRSTIKEFILDEFHFILEKK